MFTGGTNNSTAAAFCPVNLPNGATITQLSATIFDDDTGMGTAVTLYRADMNNSVPTSILSVNTTIGYSGGLATYGSGTTTHVVDNTQYSYYLEFQADAGASAAMGNQTYLTQARVHFSVSKAD
jgi:hypothetical protein